MAHASPQGLGRQPGVDWSGFHRSPVAGCQDGQGCERAPPAGARSTNSSLHARRRTRSGPGARANSQGQTTTAGRQIRCSAMNRPGCLRRSVLASSTATGWSRWPSPVGRRGVRLPASQHLVSQPTQASPASLPSPAIQPPPHSPGRQARGAGPGHAAGPPLQRADAARRLKRVDRCNPERRTPAMRASGRADAGLFCTRGAGGPRIHDDEPQYRDVTTDAGSAQVAEGGATGPPRKGVTISRDGQCRALSDGLHSDLRPRFADPRERSQVVGVEAFVLVAVPNCDAK